MLGIIKGVCRGSALLLTGAWTEVLLRNPEKWGWDIILVGVPLFIAAIYGWRED